MPLRSLEITIPKDDLTEMPDFIEGVPHIDLRMSELIGESGLVTILLDANNAEQMIDLFVKRFGTAALFRINMFPVEVSLTSDSSTTDLQDSKDQSSSSNTTKPSRISREELYEDINQASNLTATYCIMVFLSTVVALVGIMRGDVAVIIGAMVIAPLLGPNVALSLSMTLGDFALAKRSIKTSAAGVVIAGLTSIAVGIIFFIDPAAPEILSRTHPGVGDIVLALAAGAAGSLAFTSGVPAVVVGVMVAVALLPPLVVAGLLLGSGHIDLAIGATLLLSINVICVNLAAITTFVAHKISPRTWWEADQAKKSTRFAFIVWLLLLLIILALLFLGNVDSVLQGGL